MEVDIGFSHVAFMVRNINASVRFYEHFANMKVIHRRRDSDGAHNVVWMSDLIHRFALVLIESKFNRDTPLGPFGHIGVACMSRAEVDEAAIRAEALGVLLSPPKDGGQPVGYWTYISDPDGNTLELSYGQEIGFTIKSAIDT